MSLPQNSSGHTVSLLGLGSPHGDDAIGWEIIRALKTALPGWGLFYAAETLESPWDLLNYLATDSPTIIIDACRSQRATGSVFEISRNELHTVCGTSSHSGSLSTVLALAEQLGQLPQELLIIGVEITETQPGQDLTPAVRAAIPVACDRIQTQINVWNGVSVHA